MDPHSRNALDKNAWRTRSAAHQQDCPSRTGLTGNGEGARTLPMSSPYSGSVAPGFHGIPPRTRAGDSACHLRFPASSMRAILKYPGLRLLRASGKSCARFVPGHGVRPTIVGLFSSDTGAGLIHAEGFQKRRDIQPIGPMQPQAVVYFQRTARTGEPSAPESFSGRQRRV